MNQHITQDLASVDPIVNVFLTIEGFDIAISHDVRTWRTRVPYNTLKSIIGTKNVQIEFGAEDDHLFLIIEKDKYRLLQRPSGHYFGVLRKQAPKAEACTMQEARRLHQEAQKPKKPKK
jgi:hypothetical protein